MKLFGRHNRLQQILILAGLLLATWVSTKSSAVNLPPLYPKVPDCNKIPPDPGSNGNFGSCEGAPSIHPQRCAAHTHVGNEVGNCKQTNTNVEVHIKCTFNDHEDIGINTNHNYGIQVVNISCVGIPDTSVGGVGGGSIAVTPSCSGAKTCCKGPLTADDAQNYCASLPPAQKVTDPKCNNVFMLCGDSNMGSKLSPADIVSFCANRTKCTQPTCTVRTVDGKIVPCPTNMGP